MKIVNLTRKTFLADKVTVANTPFSRIKGLLTRHSLGNSEALIIEPCNSIHTFFMRFAIDVVFLDKQNRVAGLKENMIPFRLSRIYLKACLAIELPSHKISRSQTQLNDLIQFQE